jgi:arylsulfatase A-like enzyme
LIVRAPGHTKPGTSSRALVETVDIFPTLLDLCRLPALPVSDGLSFKPVLARPDRPWKSAAFHVFNRRRVIDGRNTPIVGFAVRTGTHRLVSWRTGWDAAGKVVATELYDYVSDPHETRNVADDPAQAGLRRELEGLRLAGWQAAQPKP